MNESRRISARQCGVWVVALFGHALLFLLIARVAGPPDRQRFASSEQPLLLLLDLAAPVDPPRGMLVGLTPPKPALVNAIVEPTPTSTPTPAPTAPVDWANEARLAARAATDGAGKSTARDFDAPIKPSRTRCEKRASSFEWNPEPKKAGFAGILPYVRLGRCVVGLGFFGCPIGEPPEPNSHLFDDMKNPDRVASSVPDVDRCD
ncbi:MAG: hypothetical protein ABI859_05095 [Pseudomonadota bacterium]